MVTYEEWHPGMRLTADRLLSISPTWQDWTPIWSTATGANTPDFGDAPVVARYAVAATTVHYRLQIAFDATTDFGGGGSSDNWQFSLPEEASDEALIIGYGEGAASLGSRFGIRARALTTTQMGLEVASGRVDAGTLDPTGLVDAVTPFTWSDGNTIRVAGTYEAAQ